MRARDGRRGVAHYVIGVLFAALLLGVSGLAWVRQPTFGPAVLVGVVLPLPACRAS